MIDSSTVRLFSYGTLRQPEVQRSLFGREVAGTPEELPGYRLDTVEITDPHVIALSGSAHHPILRPTGDPADRVAGTALEITEAELAAADDYEVDDYRRTLVPLASGVPAWVYAPADA
ncbi:gamma-glutamylcyclotransferase family protein [Streptomyces caatingaensis]|uniref:UDP-N-acetylmuramate--alanine ligase n=1 Tax=Streptomyces caatingaensis TaxID=1678637 RepID=A0A0K9XIN6_9ACTN|nr:gamma-glutamylcyclotransferase family protein [Streptomyces caatingaensis]KNB52926.1 UDP-N-acetylmuramate--alanine ligase [Streptomyces caatingaensis]